MSKQSYGLVILSCVLALGCPGPADEEATPPGGTVTLGEEEYTVQDIHFFGNRLALGGEELELRRLSLVGHKDSLDIYGTFSDEVEGEHDPDTKNELLPMGTVDESEIQLTLLKGAEVEGDAFGYVAYPPGSDPRPVLGGTLTLTAVGEPEEGDVVGAFRTGHRRPVEGRIKLVLATSAEVLVTSEEAGEPDTETIEGTFEGLASCEWAAEPRSK